MKLRPLHIFFVLCLAFLVYTMTIYFMPREMQNTDSGRGRLVWQKYNCQGCHQLYGLGGYLGPDLTNVYSGKGKGVAYIKALIRSGTKQMPAFTLSEEEEEYLLRFLQATDASGIADPVKFNIKATGMIERP